VVTLTKGTSAEWAAQTGRECGQCSLCCKLLHVRELNKPANQWCQHCRPGKGGCSIWGNTPDICRLYFCGWRITRAFGDEWFPLKSHMVLSLNRQTKNGVQILMVTVDPQHREIWQQEPYYGQLRELARRGMLSADPMIVIVRVGTQSWHLDSYGERRIADNAMIVHRGRQTCLREPESMPQTSV